MIIKYSTINNKCYIRAYDKNDPVGVLILDLNCDEYARYKKYCTGNKLAKLVRIETNPTYVGKGIASSLIKAAIANFKNYNIVLLCSPCKRSENTDTLKSVSDLQMFYSKFGFEKTDELLPTMIRKTNN